MIGFAVLTAFYLLGTVVQVVCHIPLPANVIGLILFTVSLFMKWVKLEWVEESGEFLIRHMLLFFTPFVVGTMVFFHMIGEHAAMMLISLFGSSIGALLITGWSAKVFKGKEEQKHEG